MIHSVFFKEISLSLIVKYSVDIFFSFFLLCKHLRSSIFIMPYIFLTEVLIFAIRNISIDTLQKKLGFYKCLETLQKKMDIFTKFDIYIIVWIAFLNPTSKQFYVSLHFKLHFKYPFYIDLHSKEENKEKRRNLFVPLLRL